MCFSAQCIRVLLGTFFGIRFAFSFAIPVHLTLSQAVSLCTVSLLSHHPNCVLNPSHTHTHTPPSHPLFLLDYQFLTADLCRYFHIIIIIIVNYIDQQFSVFWLYAPFSPNFIMSFPLPLPFQDCLAQKIYPNIMHVIFQHVKHGRLTNH